MIVGPSVFLGSSSETQSSTHLNSNWTGSVSGHLAGIIAHQHSVVAAISCPSDNEIIFQLTQTTHERAQAIYLWLYSRDFDYLIVLDIDKISLSQGYQFLIF